MLNGEKKITSYTKRRRAEKWIINNSKFLRLRAIDRELGFPINTLQKFVKKGTPLSKERIDRLYAFMIKSRKY